MGVFGWLSSAYQSSSIQYENIQTQTMTLVNQKKSVEVQLVSSKQRLDELMSIRLDQEKRMNDALNNGILSRNPSQLKQIQEQNITLIKQTTEDISEERKRNGDLYDETLS